MMTASGLSTFVDGLNLSAVHTVLALFGGLLAIYVMQKTRYEAEDREDPKVLRIVRRFALVALSGALFWSLTYGETRQWQPWPPDLLVMLALDTLLSVKALAIWARIRRRGRYSNAPSVASRLPSASGR